MVTKRGYLFPDLIPLNFPYKIEGVGGKKNLTKKIDSSPPKKSRNSFRWPLLPQKVENATATFRQKMDLIKAPKPGFKKSPFFLDLLPSNFRCKIEGVCGKKILTKKNRLYSTKKIQEFIPVAIFAPEGQKRNIDFSSKNGFNNPPPPKA